MKIVSLGFALTLALPGLANAHTPPEAGAQRPAVVKPALEPVEGDKAKAKAKAKRTDPKANHVTSGGLTQFKGTDPKANHVTSGGTTQFKPGAGKTAKKPAKKPAAKGAPGLPKDAVRPVKVEPKAAP